MNQYNPKNYGESIGVSREAAERDIVVARPGWFARIFLRRKPTVWTLRDAVAAKAAAAKRAEEELARDLFLRVR